MFIQNLEKIGAFILDLVFPKLCLGCQKEGAYLCRNCFQSIGRLIEEVCPVCHETSEMGQVCPSCREKSYLAGLTVACSYDDEILAAAIKNFKYRFVEGLAEPLGRILGEALGRGLVRNLDGEDWVLSPIPLHPWRERWRGFNQSALMAREARKILREKYGTSLSISESALRRKKSTGAQMKLGSVDRWQNIKGAFVVDRPELVRGKSVLLVDDVATTRATLEEAAKTLIKTGGVKKAWGLVLARGG